MFEKVIKVYEKEYKKLLILPFSILVFFSGVIIFTKITTGEFFKKDISLKGGTSITYYTDEPINEVESWLINTWGQDTQLILINEPLGGFKGYDFRVGQELTVDEVRTSLSELVGRDLSQQEFSMGLQGASIATNFFNEALIIIAISFVFMSLVVLYYFRNLMPALSITFSTIADVIVIIGVLNLLGIPMSVAGIGALLMIIGMSTDSDMLLAANIIKRKDKTLMDRLIRGFRTELTMTLAAITTAVVMYSLTTISMIKSIAFILLIGSISDILNTWILSAGLQRIYMERRGK